MTQTRQTLDQQRAAYALQQIRELGMQGENSYGNYVSYVSALPATIVMNGLGQALLTLLAKSQGDRHKPHRLLFNHVAGWLNTQIKELRCSDANNMTPVINRLLEQNQDVYVLAQAEAMAYLNWLKQFARAYLKEQEGQE